MSAHDPSGHSRPRLEAGFSPRPDFPLERVDGRESPNGNARRKSGELGAARHSRERLGGDENSAMIIERAFGIVSVTRNLLNQFAIRLENSRIGTGKMSAFGMISQRRWLTLHATCTPTTTPHLRRVRGISATLHRLSTR